MKHNIIFFTLILSVFCSILQAQDQPITFNPNILAHSQGLPNDFLLFSPDTSVQILFNPARAALSEQRFVYTNYLPNSSSPLTMLQTSSLQRDNGYRYKSPNYSGPTISAATLFDGGGSIWLLQLSNWVYRNAADFNSSTQISLQPTYSGNRLTNSSSLSNGSLTAMKLSKIGTMGNNSYSIGAFGIVFPQDENSNDNRTNEEYTPAIPSYSSERHYKYVDKNRSQGKNSKYAFGLEFSLAGSEWDMIVGITMQKNEMDGTSTYNSNTYNSYKYTSDTNTTIQSMNGTAETKTDNPFVYGLSGYYRHSSDLITSTDHYFISSNIYYSKNSLFYKQNGEGVYWYQRNSNIPDSDTTNFSLYQKEQATNWGAALSFGYLITRKLFDIEILLGFNPRLGYDKFKNANPLFPYLSSSSIEMASINEHQIWSTSLQIPIYLNYTPVNWFSLFGGLNYKYVYIYERINGLQQFQQNQNGQNIVTNQSQTQALSNLNSSSNVYAGMELRHASGLHIQIAFRGSIASYSGWNISLGYVY